MNLDHQGLKGAHLTHADPLSPSTTHAARLAHRLHAFVTVGGLLGLLAMLSCPWWMSERWLLQLAAFQWHVAPEHMPAHLPADSLWLTRAALLLPGPLGLIALWHLRQLLAHYRQGALFDVRAARLLRNVGLWLTSMGALQTLVPTLGALALTLHNAPGHRILAFGIGFENYTVLLFGPLIVMLASVMLEAARIAQENQEFV